MLLKQKGPLLLVANHPNSFLDAIIIAAFFDQKIHSLARGDAFGKSWHRYLLSKLNMIPVYRISEGKQNLNLNYNSFEACKEILLLNGIVLIFIEGVCKNTHHLLPFKKGAARIIEDCIDLEIPIKIMPIALGYSSFCKMPLAVNMTLNEPFGIEKLRDTTVPLFKQLNEICFKVLTKSIHIPDQQKYSAWQKVLYFFTWPYVQIVKNFVIKKTANTVFYHSVLFAVLLLSFLLFSILIIFTIVFLVLN